MRLKPWRRFDNRAFLKVAYVVVLLSGLSSRRLPYS
jgi:hypothetical protein